MKLYKRRAHLHLKYDTLMSGESSQAKKTAVCLPHTLPSLNLPRCHWDNPPIIFARIIRPTNALQLEPCANAILSAAARRLIWVGGGGARRPRLIGGGVAGKHGRWRRLAINYWKLATTNNKQCTIRLSSILYCGITFKRKQTTNESYYHCSQHFRLNFVGPIFI